MKHIKLFEHYAQNIIEGINYNGAVDADLPSIGVFFADANVDKQDEKALTALAVDALKKASPIPLTGKIKEDGAKLIKYITTAFDKHGVVLDEGNALVYSGEFTNQIEIPVKSLDRAFWFQTYLDYEDLAGNGSKFVLPGDFVHEQEGTLGFLVPDLGNGGAIVKSAALFNEYIQNIED